MQSKVISMIPKPEVVVTAMRWTGDNFNDIREFCHGNARMITSDLSGVTRLFIETLEGSRPASINDWIICGTLGEYYPIKPEVVEQKYNIKEDSEE